MAYGGHFAQSQRNNKPVQYVLFNKENLVIIDMVSYLETFLEGVSSVSDL